MKQSLTHTTSGFYQGEKNTILILQFHYHCKISEQARHRLPVLLPPLVSLLLFLSFLLVMT
uniref:Uncharacterized protein n=1 Tax=Arundo donax TaxID=35708 RepID=A0A0A9G323_ARUDO